MSKLLNFNIFFLTTLLIFFSDDIISIFWDDIIPVFTVRDTIHKWDFRHYYSHPKHPNGIRLSRIQNYYV